MDVRFTRLADQDLVDLIRASRRHFGDRQGLAYAALIRAAMKILALEPDHLASRPRPDLGGEVSSLHVSVAARRRSAARHVIFYRLEGKNGPLVVLRLLHDAMESAGRVTAALEEDLKRSSPRHPPR